VHRLQSLARLCREEYGLVPCFHPHGGTYIENVKEIETLLEYTDPGTLSFCVDTGHIAFGGADPIEVTRRHAQRIGHVHLKDIDLPRLRGLLARGENYVRAAQQGVFVELGQGSLDLTALLDILFRNDYRGWIVVEADRVCHLHTDTLGSARRSRQYLREHLGGMNQRRV